MSSDLRRVTADDLGQVIAPEDARRFMADLKGGKLIREASLLDLQTWGDTDWLAGVLAETRARLAAVHIAPSANPRKASEARAAVREAERQYTEALRRDQIRATRPEYCWCLGYGGSAPRYTPMPTGQVYTGHDGHERNEIEEVETLTRHCDCLEGFARAERDAEVLAQYREEKARRAVIRRFGDAKLPLEYQRYPWRDHPDRTAVTRCARWLDDPRTERDAHHWLLLYGPGGRGKTTILAGMASELAEAGVAVLFRPMPDLLSDIRGTFGKSEDQESLRTMLKSGIRYLFLDDIGAEVPRDWVGEFLYEILNHRHNGHMPVIMSTNLWSDPGQRGPDGQPGRGLEEFAEHMGIRIWGRVKRMAEPILMIGQDLRDLPHRSKPVTTS